ncbi:MAG: DUF3784 domain-containing protein [Bacteroidota bacterium]
MMEYINIGIGLFLILSGFLVQRYPNLIAGYNTMSAERKKSVNIEGLSIWMRNSFLGMGVLTILGYYALHYIGLEGFANNVMLITLIAGSLLLVFTTSRFDHGKAE